MHQEERASINEKRKDFTPRGEPDSSKQITEAKVEEAEEAGKGEEKKEEQSADKNEGKDSGLGWQATAVIVGALVVAGAAYLVKRAYKK